MIYRVVKKFAKSYSQYYKCYITFNFNQEWELIREYPDVVMIKRKGIMVELPRFIFTECFREVNKD